MALAQKPATEISHPLGTVSEGHYQNELLGFGFDFSPTYVVLTRDESKIYEDAGADIITNGNADTSKRMGVALERQTTLISVLEKSFGAQDNSTLEIVAVKQKPTVTANMALAASIGLMTSSGKFKLTRSVTGRYGRRSMPGALIETDIGSIHLYQEVYATMLRGYGCIFAISYQSDRGRKAMLDILESLVFEK
jgi:hypothetical protein